MYIIIYICNDYIDRYANRQIGSARGRVKETCMRLLLTALSDENEMLCDLLAV